jgi:hypothetical protein
MKYCGRCHCGAIRFEVEAPEDLEVLDCNCSICSKTGFLHLIVPCAHFRLLAGGDSITTYRFNTGIAQHTFCRFCGIKPFYVPRSNPDGIDVNARVLEPVPRSMCVVPFDGRDWEQHAPGLAHKSVDS